MPNYAIPGVTMGRRGARTVGAVALVVAAVAALTWRSGLDDAPDGVLRLQLRTEQIGQGVIPGTRVRLDGVMVGSVAEIAPAGPGQQLITLDLERTQTGSLTDALSVDYAPENLFGISAVALRAGTGGAPLRDGSVVDLSGRHAARVNDVTMGVLLQALTETSTEVLTPQLSDLIHKFSSQLRSFTPLFEAIITLSTAVADTQRYPSDYLLDQYAAFFGGAGEFTGATFRLVNAILNIEIFVTDRPRYDAFIDLVVTGVLPAIGNVGAVAEEYFIGYTTALTPVVAAVAATVPDPRRSKAEMDEIVRRLQHMFIDTPDGPALNVAVTLRGMPGLAIPLLGEQGYSALGGPR
ncbi:mammalian cell entry protein [Nocardia sp. XZ_19_385]|uniref:mammalian cell entry protein n=1 Tax=Nocardia sp. XZ_19_385 TaxID=2769488 RepID=UPI00188F99AE|nr:mammalian cell entry protein [Nocardia sp. XZ_19_385]